MPSIEAIEDAIERGAYRLWRRVARWKRRREVVRLARGANRAIERDPEVPRG